MFSVFSRDRRSRSGQTLVISILVMFIVAAIAAVFIALIARNLFRASRSSNVDAVAQIAEAGIRYADEMLTTSEDGADWRPKPDNVGISNAPDYYTSVYPEPAGDQESWLRIVNSNPDYKWTRPWWPTEWVPSGWSYGPGGIGVAGPTGGFSTFKTGQGRFLLRVSYNPDPKDPLSKYIKIESIGRWGFFDTQDPTTWKPRGDVNLRRELTAFKPIGVTDYLRFITNKNKRSMDFALGCPGFYSSFGRPETSDWGERGAPIRVNGNLVWYGSGLDSAVDIYLRGVLKWDDTLSSYERVPLDTVEVAGEIKHADPDMRVHVYTNFSDSSYDYDSVVYESDNPDYSTVYGFYRDGSPAVDADRMARGIKRIEPPLVDQTDQTRSTTRYRLLTLNSGERVQVGGRWRNLGRYGWGRGVYISNRRDNQNESETLFGGYTLRADWLKPNSPLSTYWVGPYYVPPGVIINLYPYDIDGDDKPDMTITRTDERSGGRKVVWYDAWGNPRPEWGQTVIMPYPVKGRVVSNGTDTKILDGNGVIYAEGNIRIRGMLPPGVQLTVVSNENIYIEGNLLKYRDSNGKIDESCGLSLLARENVCVNTTQFFGPLNGLSADDVGSDARNGQPPFHVIISEEPDSRMRVGFEFGPWESETSKPSPGWMLMLRHAGEYGSSYVNSWINGNNLLWNDGVASSLPPHVWGVGDPGFGNAPCIGSTFAGEVFPRDPAKFLSDINGLLYTNPGARNVFEIALDQTTYTRNNYLMGGFAIQPFDVRIEAVIYAQEGSFFVIPGTWFNPNPQDTKGNRRPPWVDKRFPYFGDPLDIRIIIDGAVSENIPAPISAVSEWMSKWGRIPETYGASSIPTAHAGEGLTFLYDDHVGWPLDSSNNPIRRDEFGRPLPITPKLPVSGSLIYFGDAI